MHLVVLDGVLFDGTEGPEAHMQRHIADLHALGLNGLQQLRREVQSRRGSRGAAQDLGVDGLIPLLILQLLFDVGRQRPLAQMFQHLQEDPVVVEADQAVSAFQFPDYLGGQLAVAEGELGPRAHLPARPHQAFPSLVAPVNEQQHLTGAAAGEPAAPEAGRAAPGSR